MGLKIVGSITIRVKDEDIEILGHGFGIEEEDRRSLGDGDYQYEALFIYFDPDGRFKVKIQATEFEGKVGQVTEPSIEGIGVIVQDNLDAEVI